MQWLQLPLRPCKALVYVHKQHSRAAHLADDLSDSSESGWEWLTALSQKPHRPLPPMAMSRSVSGINPLFQGDISRAALPLEQDTPSHQSFNPAFRALPAQYGQLELGSSSSWQLQGLAANSRTTAQELAALAWSQSISSSSVEVPAQTAQTDAQLGLDDLPANDEIVSMARLLADDRQDSTEWVSSSSSSEDVVPPLRSLSFPNSVLLGAFRREEMVGARGLGRDTSLPVSVQLGLSAELWSAGQHQLPGPTLRQRFMQEQQPGLQAASVDQEGPEQTDIWAALERQPSPVITLRQRYAEAEENLQQEAQGQGSSSMQPSQAVLELSPEDIIILQEPSLDQEQAAVAQAVLAQEPGVTQQHQQSGLQPQLDGVSARSMARQMAAARQQAVTRRLSDSKKPFTAELSAQSEVASEARTKAPRRLRKLPTAMFSEPAWGTDESANKGVHFGSAAADDKDQNNWQQARSLARARSSLKQTRSPQNSLRRRSFRSSVSFAPVSTESDSDNDDDVGSKSKAPINAAGKASTAAPLLKTVSSVWASITSSGGRSPSVPAAAAAVPGSLPTQVESRSYVDMPAAKPPRPPADASPSRSRWQAASKKAVAAVTASNLPVVPAKRSFFDVVTQAAVHGKPPLSRRLGQEHVEMGVRMLLEARTTARSDSQKGGLLQQDSSQALQTHPSLAKVMQVLSAKHMSKSVSMASTVQVRF